MERKRRGVGDQGIQPRVNVCGVAPKRSAGGKKERVQGAQKANGGKRGEVVFFPKSTKSKKNRNAQVGRVFGCFGWKTKRGNKKSAGPTYRAIGREWEWKDTAPPQYAPELVERGKKSADIEKRSRGERIAKQSLVASRALT